MREIGSVSTLLALFNNLRYLQREKKREREEKCRICSLVDKRSHTKARWRVSKTVCSSAGWHEVTGSTHGRDEGARIPPCDRAALMHMCNESKRTTRAGAPP